MADAKKTLALEAKMKDLVSKDLRKMGKEGKTAGASIAAGFVKAQLALGALKLALRAGIRFVKSMTTEVANQGDKISKMSRQFGIATETLSEWSHVAGLAGSSMEGIGRAMQNLARNMVDAQRGLATPVEVFEQLGLKITDDTGRLKKLDVMMLEAADVMKSMEGQTERTGLAMKLFGQRAGLQMVNVLEQGSDAIRAQIKEAHELGAVWTTLEGQKAEAFNDALLRMKTAFEGVKRAVAVELFPELTKLFNKLAVWIAENRGKIADWAREFLDEAIPAIKRFGEEAIPVLQEIGRVAKDVADTLQKIRGDPIWSGGKPGEGIAGRAGKGRRRPPEEPVAEEPPVTTLEETIVAVRKEFTGFTGGMLEAIEITRQWNEAALALGRTFALAFTDQFTNAVFAIQDGTKKIGAAFREMEVEILKSLQRVLLSHITSQFLEIFAGLLPSSFGGINFVPVSQNSVSTLPPTAEGGIVTRAQARIVGEAGPEAIIPLNKMGFGGSVTINQTIVPSQGMDERALANMAAAEVTRQLQSSNRMRKQMRNVVRGGLI